MPVTVLLPGGAINKNYGPAEGIHHPLRLDPISRGSERMRHAPP